MKTTTIEQRIEKVVLELFRGNNSRFAEKIGIGSSFLSRVKTGKKLLPKHCDPALISLNINPNWIRTGDGEMTIGAININGNSNNLHDIQQIVRESEAAYQVNKPLLDKNEKD